MTSTPPPPAPQDAAAITPELLRHLQSWQGRSETVTDFIGHGQAAAMAATLDRDEDSLPPSAPLPPLPPLWHWAYFLRPVRQSLIGDDGHPRRGGFVPPVPLPRRMWAGGRLQWTRPLAIGAQASRTSTIESVTYKPGRTGELVFVDVRHEYTDADGVALVEHHDIVYRAAPAAGAPAPAPVKPPLAAVWRRQVTPDPVLLFRYSALTLNGHRIHYDRTYVTQVEGYAGLVVHGPLLATLLMELLTRSLPAARVQGFSFKAVRPIVDIHHFFACGRPREDGRGADLWIEDHEGNLAMQATAQF